MASNINTKLCLEWANSLLAEVNMAVTTLTDFQEASVLSLLVDLLWPASHLQPLVLAMSGESNLKQLCVIFDHLQSLKVKHSVAPEELLNGESTSLLDLMWALMLHLCIHTPKVSPFQRNVKMGQRSLLNWCRQELPYMCVDHMDTMTNNVCHDGMLIDLLCHFCSVEHDPDPVQYLRNCLKAAQDELSISENILEPIAVIEGSEDEISLLIYLALLRRKVKQRSEGQVGSKDSSIHGDSDGASTRPQNEVRPCDITGHSDQPSSHIAETNFCGQSDSGAPCCHGDGLFSCREQIFKTSPKSHSCSIWCGDDDVGSHGTVVMATSAQSEKRLHKIGQVVMDVDADSNSNEARESIEASLEIGGPTDESSQDAHVITFSIQDEKDGNQGHDLQPHSDTDSGVMAHREASESESGIESNWGNSVTHDLSCDGCEGHFDGRSCDMDVVTDLGVSEKTLSVTQGDDTLREDVHFSSESDTTLDGSDGDDPRHGWTRVSSPDTSRKAHIGGGGCSRSGGDEDAQDPAYVYTSKIYVTLSGPSDQSDLPLHEAVAIKGDDCRLTRQPSLFDELQQVDGETLLKADVGEDNEVADRVEVERSMMSYSETFGLELSGPMTVGDKNDNTCCHGYSETPRETDPSDGQTELDIQKLKEEEGKENKQDDPKTERECPEMPDELRRENDEDKVCERDGEEAGTMEDQDSVEIATDLSYEDSFEESVRDIDTEDCCAGSAEFSESETTSTHNVVDANPQCTAPPESADKCQMGELRLDLARDIMVDEVSVTSDDPTDWMEASVNSLIASANRDWLQQNILSDSAQSRNEEFAALQKALMMRTIQCVVSEQLSLGTMGQSVDTDQDEYFVLTDDESTKSPVSAPNLCPVGNDELLHLLDMIGMQGQEMRKELVMSQTREVYLQEEILNEDEQLVEVVDGLQQELSMLKEDNEKLHDELVLNKMLKLQFGQEVESLKGVVRRLCGHIENLEVEVTKMHEDMVPRQVTKNAAMVTELPCRFNFAMQTEFKVKARDAESQITSPQVSTVDSCIQTQLESPALDSCHDDNNEKMSNNMTAMIDKILEQMANMTGRSSVSSTPIYGDDTDTDDTWQANEESDSDATVQVMKQHLANAMMQYDLTKSELEHKNSLLQQEVESSTTSLCDMERELKKVREENDVLKVLTEGDKAEMDILKDKIAVMEKAISAAQNVNERLNLRLETTLNEVSMMMPTTGGELKEKITELEEEKKKLEQTVLQIREEHSQGAKTVTDLRRSLAVSEDQKDRLWTEVKVLLDEYGLLKTDADEMENILQQHVPEIYGSVTIRGKRHGHVLVRSLSELKEHVFGEQKLPELGSHSSGSLRSLHNAQELSLQAPRDCPSAATIHENIMKQSQMVLNNIDDVGVDSNTNAPVVNWQDVCQSIASQLVSESSCDMNSRVPIDSTKVMPLFNIMLKELDIHNEHVEAIRTEPCPPQQCLPKQVLGLAKSMETELGVGSTNGSSTHSLSALSGGSTCVDSAVVKAEGDDRSSTCSDRNPIDHERLNREYEELKKKRLHLLIQAYTGNPDPDSLIARARSQVNITTHNPSMVEPQVVTSEREMEAMKKLEASRARMYAMKEKLRLGQPLEYHIASTSGDDVPEADDSQSMLDVNSRRRLAEAISVQEMSPVVQRQSMVWKKTIAPLNDNTRPSCYFSVPLMSSSPREEMSHSPYVEGSQRLQNTQPFYHQQHRQIYPHKKGYKTAEQFADGNFESSNYADLMMDNGMKSPRVNSEIWLREKPCVLSEQDGVYWTQGDDYVVTENCRDPEYDDMLNKSAESRRDDTTYDWQRSRQTQSCWNLTNTCKDVTSRHVMPIPDHCRSLTLHSQSLVDISSRHVLAEASDTDSRLDMSARSATELHCTDTSLQESDHMDTSAYSDDSPRTHTPNLQSRRLPDNVYYVQERHRRGNCVRVDDRDHIADIRPTFERARDERLKTYVKHDILDGVYSDKSQLNHHNVSADSAVKPGNPNWTSYYQRRCRTSKDPQEIMLPASRPESKYGINSESKPLAFKDVGNGQGNSGGDGKYNCRLAVRDNPRRSEEPEDAHAPKTGSEARKKSTCHVTSRELYESPECRDTRTNSLGYCREDHPKTVKFSDGDARRKLIYPDASQHGPRETMTNSTSMYANYQQNKECSSEKKSNDTDMRPKNRCWDDDEDGETVRSSGYAGCWRDKDQDVDEGLLKEPPSPTSGPLKEQHIQMLNARRLSVNRDDDSSTSMSDVDFVVMRSGDIVRRRKKAKGRKKDAQETLTRGAKADEVVSNDRGLHPNLDVITEGKKCLEEEEDYLGDYRPLQLVSGTVKADDWTESKRHVGFSSVVRSSEGLYGTEPRRSGVSKLKNVGEKNDKLNIAGTSSVKRSAAAALQLERDLVAAGKLMEEIEKCKLVSLNKGKMQSNSVTDDTQLKTKPEVVTTDDAELEFGDRQKRGVTLAKDNVKSLSSIMECTSEDTAQKKEDTLTSDDVKEKVPDVPEHKGPVLTEEQKKYANELIDKYAYQWEQTRIQLQPPSEQVLCVSTSNSENVKVVESTAVDNDVDQTVKDPTSNDTSEINRNSKVSFEVDEIMTRYNQEWLNRQQVVTAGDDQ